MFLPCPTLHSLAGLSFEWAVHALWCHESAAADQKFFRQCRRQTGSQNEAFNIRLSEVIYSREFICLSPTQQEETVVNLCSVGQSFSQGMDF